MSTGTAQNMEEVQTCTKCGETKALDDFHRDKHRRNGRSCVCKPCANKRALEHFYANPARYRASEKERRKRPEVRARVYAQIAASRARHPGKYEARRALNNAVRDGRVKRLPCERCQTTNKVHGHHEDYSKPLEVRWLCSRCHGIEHRESEMGKAHIAVAEHVAPEAK